MFNGKIVKRLREAKGLTQRELAEMLGENFQRQHIYAYEKGICAPRAANLTRLAEALGVDVRVFFN